MKLCISQRLMHVPCDILLSDVCRCMFALYYIRAENSQLLLKLFFNFEKSLSSLKKGSAKTFGKKTFQEQ